MAQVSFPITTYLDSSGKPLANGYLLINLTFDAAIGTTSSQVCAGLKVQVNLDSNGVITGSPVFWQNSSLSPSGSMYVVEAYEANGQLVSRIFVTV